MNENVQCYFMQHTRDYRTTWGGAARTVGGVRRKILAVLNAQRFQIAVRLETGNGPMTNMPVIGNTFLGTDPHRHTSAPTAAALRCLPRAIL